MDQQTFITLGKSKTLSATNGEITVFKGKYEGVHKLKELSTKDLGNLYSGVTKFGYYKYLQPHIAEMKAELLTRATYKVGDMFLLDWNNYKQTPSNKVIIYKVKDVNHNYFDIFNYIVVAYFKGRWGNTPKNYDDKLLTKLNAVKVEDPDSPMIAALYE